MSAAPTVNVPAGASRAELRRAARWALWRAGDLRYLLHAGQLDALSAFFASDQRRFVLCTGRRWGKSRFMVTVADMFAVHRALWRAGQEPPSWCPGWWRTLVMRTKKPARVVYAAPTAGMVAEFIEPHMRLLASHAPPELRPEQSQGEWVFPEVDRVVVRGCEDRKKADRLRGAEADLGIADEGGFIPILDYVVRSVLGPQLWETRGRMLLPSTPPESPDHPFVDLLSEAEAKGAAFRARTADAPHITPAMLADAIEDAGGEDSVAWQREGEAQIIIDPSHVVVPEWGEAEPHIVAEHQRPPYFVPCVIGDLGYEDLTVIAFGYHDFAADLDVIERELVLRRSTSAEIDARCREIERELWGTVPVGRRRIDATPITRADMARLGEDGEGETWTGVRKDDRTASVNALRIRVKRHRLRVHPSCTTIIAHARYGRWNRRRTDLERPDSGEHHYDGLDALRYFVRDLDRSTNPYPALEGVSTATHHIGPSAGQSAAARTLERLLFPRTGR